MLSDIRSGFRVGVALAICLATSQAHADEIAIADVASTPENAEMAGALTLVLRSYVGSDKQRVRRSAIAKVVAQIGSPQPTALALPTESIEAALQAIEADKWLESELTTNGGMVELRLVAHSRDGSPKQRKVSAPLGDYDTLAREGAAAAAKLVGAVALSRPKTGSFAKLAAAARASAALASGDVALAATALMAAPPRLGYEISATREIAQPIIDSKRIRLDQRMNAALVSGDLEAAKKLASSKSASPFAAALLARIAIARVDHRAAGDHLRKASRSKERFVILARAALASDLNQSEKLASSYATLLGAKPYIPALALALEFIPGALGDRQEAALLESAKRVASEYPTLSSEIAMRALRGGRRGEEVFELIDGFEISIAALKELKSEVAELADGPLKSRIIGEIAIRENDLETASTASRIALNLNPDNRRAQRLAMIVEGSQQRTTREEEPLAGAAKGTATATELRDPKRASEIRQLADDLAPLLAAFPSLGPKHGRIVLVQQTGSRELFFWPSRVHPKRFRDGLQAALESAPYGLSVALEAAEIEPRPTGPKLVQLTVDHDASGVIVYSVRSDGFDVEVGLMFYNKLTNKAESYGDVLTDGGQHAVVTWNPVFVVAVAAITLSLFLWLIWLVVRGTGTVRLEIKTDPASERPSFSVLLSRRSRCPVVIDPKAHIASVTSEAKTSRFQAHNVGATTEFERIPPGTWYVHVFGAFEKAGESRCLPATTVVAKVKRSRAEVVSVDLVPKESEFHVLISGDGGPAAGAAIWLSSEPAKRTAADVGGKGVVFAPPGEHTLHVSYRGTEVARNLTAFGSKVSTIHINLVRERRLAEVAEGLDLDLGPEPVSTPVSGLAVTNFPSTGEDTPVPSPLTGSEQDEHRPSVESFRAAAYGETTGLPSPDQLAGLRRYQREDVLGRGAMGVVYRAHDQVLDRVVALKVMTPEVKAHPLAARMFEQEAKALAALNHPNVVTVFDQGRDGDEMYLVMEFVDGQTLEDALQERGRLPLEEAASVGEQLGRSLSYAHSRRVIHRDIKPANVFLAANGSVKLGDFGLARVLKEVQIKSTEIKGTPLYMSPEQIRGSDIDFRADIYALGCTMYEALAGRPPFIEGEILYHHIHTEPERISKFVEVPSEVEQLVMKCIAKSKSDRVASADRIAEVFGAIRRNLG